MQNGLLDQGYTISFGKLHEFLVGADKLKIERAALFGSRPLRMIQSGNMLYAPDLKFILKMEILETKRKIDTGIATLITKDA